MSGPVGGRGPGPVGGRGPGPVGGRGPGPDPVQVEALLTAMTLDERIAQITQVDRSAITPEEVAQLGIGSVLSGGGGNPQPNTPVTWRAMVDRYLDAATGSRLGVPLLYGTDAVHGHSNVVGATIFPHNLALGAADDPELVRSIGRATALETAATGARWVFSPMVAVPQDLRWGRTYECFGDDPIRVAELGASLIEGLQGEGPVLEVLACAKHFIADGATTWGTTGGAGWSPWWVRSYGEPGWMIDQGDARIDEATLRGVHLPPYRAAVAAGVGSVMASYSSWHGTKLHAHRGLLTDLLKRELGFDGPVVSDYLALDQVDPDPLVAAVRCLSAGIDVVMVPFDHERFRGVVREAVLTGQLPMARLDDAVRRLLRAKQRLGLLAPEPPPRPELTVVGCEAHRQLAREAAGKGTVRLADPAGVLPISDAGAVLVAGAAADDVGLACGGWTITWDGGRGAVTPGATLLDGLREQLGSRVHHLDAAALSGPVPDGPLADVGVVTVHEEPYAEGRGDREQLTVDPHQVGEVRAVAARCRRVVLVVMAGRPLRLDELLPHVDAVVVAWWPGSEAAGVADVLVGARPLTGRLPISWPGPTLPARPPARS